MFDRRVTQGEYPLYIELKSTTPKKSVKSLKARYRVKSIYNPEKHGVHVSRKPSALDARLRRG